MSWLNIFGSIASIVGLAVSFYTLYRVATLPGALKRHSRDRHLTELIDKISRIPENKRIIPESMAREIEFIVSTIRNYYVSPWPFRQHTLKTLLEKLEREMAGQRRKEIVQNQLRLLRDETMIQ